MLKEDLKDGMILETRNGDRHLLTNGVMRDFKGFMRLADYSDDLKFNDRKHYDVMKVYKDTEMFSLTSIFKDEYLTLLWERKETELTYREVEVLKALMVLGHTYIARDKNGDLYAYENKPEKITNEWLTFCSHYFIKKDLFNFIKWEDIEPINIDNLLKGESI